MPGITIAAILTSAIASTIVCLVIFKQLQPTDRIFALLGFMGSAAAFFGALYLLRLSLDSIFNPWAQIHPTLYRWETTLYAPLTEEPAKWIILILLFLTGKINHKNKAAYAICIGFGFGMGEIALLARNIALDPQNLSIPWYMSSGFIVERLMVCFIHSALVLIAADALCYHKLWLLCAPLVFHWLLNAPIFLSYSYPIGTDRTTWSTLLWIWNDIFFVGALVYLGLRMFNPPERAAFFLGKAICPECKTLYVRPWWGINQLKRRYERCPNCKHYHWTTLFVEDAGVQKTLNQQDR